MKLGRGALIGVLYSVSAAVLLMLWVVGGLKHFQWNPTELTTITFHTTRLADYRAEKMLNMSSLTYEGRDIISASHGVTNQRNQTKIDRFVSKPPVGMKCEVPPGGFKAWGHGVVTMLAPQVAVNCSKILSGDETELEKVNKAMSVWKNALSDEAMLNKMHNCSWLQEYFSDNLYNSELEKSFPLAFTFVVYDSPQQVLRLIRLLYRPQNVYCIHYDVKSQHKQFFQSLARCIDNVVIASRLENVVWGYYTIMQAQMNCMQDLLEYRNKQARYKWKYLINLCGKELPLVTNRDMVVKMLKLNGSSSIVAQSCSTRSKVTKRIEHPVRLNANQTGIVVNEEIWLKDRPFNLSLFHKSSSYNALSFQFANYLAFNQTAKVVYDFFKQTKNAEEHFYATLYKTPGIPGGSDRHIPKSHYFEVSGSFWTKVTTFQRLKRYGCLGKVVHEVCVVGAGDLAAVVREKGHLFHNKYFMGYDHSIMNCMEERLVSLNKLEYQQECGVIMRPW